MNSRGKALWATVLAALAPAAGLPAGALAQTPQPVAPYDGSNPYRCELQDVGTGTAFAHPEADPFCVKFDKTNQNVTEFGLVDFLLQEPARTAAAIPKCFYYQRDEWTGSIVQGTAPELWHWVGGYLFNKAQALGGVSVRQFRVGGTPFSAYPYVPAEYQPYFDQAGGGGAQLTMPTIGEPDCTAKVDTPEERSEVFRAEASVNTCVEARGDVRGRRVGPVKLRTDRKTVRGALGDPEATNGRADVWCVVGGGYLQVVFKRSGAALIRTTVGSQTVEGVGTGSNSKRAVRKLDLTRLFKVRGTNVLSARRGPNTRLLVGASGRRVRWIAIADPGAFADAAALKRTLKTAIG